MLDYIAVRPAGIVRCFSHFFLYRWTVKQLRCNSRATLLLQLASQSDGRHPSQQLYLLFIPPRVVAHMDPDIIIE